VNHSRGTLPRVSAPPIELAPATPWVLRIFDRAPFSAFWVGAAIGLALFFVFLLYTALFGERTGRLAGLAIEAGWAAELLQDLFFGFTLAVAAASVRGAVRDVDALRPALDAEDFEALRRRAFTWRPEIAWPVAAAAGTFSAIVTASDPALWLDGRFPGWLHAGPIWLAIRNFANWAAVGFAAALELLLGSGFSRLGERLREVDLLDRAPLVPFARRALRGVSLWMLLAAFLSLNYAGEGWASALLPLGLLQLAAFATAAFLLPLTGVHRRLRARKARELERVRAAIRHSVEGSDAPVGHLSDLLAWEARVQAVREWPIESSTFARLLLFVALGMGSWLGAALVDQMLGRALG
jgi:hypothetical protein